MGTPDLTPYIDLTFYDKDPQDIIDEAMLDLQTKLPDWQPREGNVEVLLLESLALPVAQSIFAINRLPGAVVMAILRLYGIEPDPGLQPTVQLTFNVSDALGHDIPADTGVRLDLAGGLEPVVFTTTEALAIPAGSSSGTVLASGDRFTADANGVASGTVVQLIDSIPFVDTVVTASLINDGIDPQTDDEWIERGVQRFARLSETLVLPRHFEAKALENPSVIRAKALADYTPTALTTPTGVTATPQTTGGTLAAGTYSYRVSAINANGETLASAAVTATTTGTTGRVTVAWSAVAPGEALAPSGYRIYGRVGGSELLLATVASNVITWDDTGAITPAGALPAANTTVGAPGTAAGHVTVAVYGNAATVPADVKATLDADMEDAAAANLSVHVIDPTITTQNVTVTVARKAGYDDATVVANVTAAIQAFLSPATWDWDTTIRRNQLMSVISNADGVDYVDTLTTPAADVALSGYATLVTAGSVAVTTHA